MISPAADRDALHCDWNFTRVATGNVVGPDAEVTFERDRAAVRAHRRPHDAAIAERRDRASFALGRLHPQVLRAGLVRDEVQRAAIAASRSPHRPLLLRVALRHLLILGRGRSVTADDPELALVEMR